MRILTLSLSLLALGLVGTGCAASTEPTDDSVDETLPPIVGADKVSPQKSKWDLCQKLLTRCVNRCSRDAFTSCSGGCVDDYIDCGTS